MKKLIDIFVVLLACVVYLIWTANTVSAHRVNVFAWVENGTVHVESKFSGGKKVRAGKVSVLDQTGRELLSGKTDDQGRFSFKIPAMADLKIALVAGQGHRGEWTIPLAEIQTAVDASGPLPKPDAEANNQDPGMKEILGGLGILLVLTGLIAAIQKRKKK